MLTVVAMLSGDGGKVISSRPSLEIALDPNTASRCSTAPKARKWRLTRKRPKSTNPRAIISPTSLSTKLGSTTSVFPPQSVAGWLAAVTRVQVQQPVVPRELPSSPHVAACPGRPQAAGHDHGSVSGAWVALFGIVGIVLAACWI